MVKLSKNKRLGQYFTGIEIAKLTAQMAITINHKIKSAIDPMLGEGDMLFAIKSISNSVALSGIEIDSNLKDRINKRFGATINFVSGNCFDVLNLKKTGTLSFDLVITNPPFVRHLNQKESSLIDDFVVPSDVEIRNGLLDSLSLNSDISTIEKKLLIMFAKTYSGVSDLTVPSIILCASLTKISGVLALVLPESSLKREYSISTLLLLSKLFSIKAIIKDEKSSWFDSAQVKTLLVFCEKLDEPRESILDHPVIPIVELSEDASPDFPIGKKYSSNDYLKFSKALVFSPELIEDVFGFKTNFHSINNLISPIFTPNKLNKSILDEFPELKELEKTNSTTSLQNLNELELLVHNKKWLSLEDLGFTFNQGLRTGANAFFYGKLLSKSKQMNRVEFAINDAKYNVDIPDKFLKIVLQKQKELPPGYHIKKEDLCTRLLFLSNYHRKNDRSELKKRIVEDNSIDNFINEIENQNIGSEMNPKYIHEFSAVKTNKIWYQLPALQKRHLPDLFIPRVNSNYVKCFSVEEDVVVDANFLTISGSESSRISRYALLAYMNSNWVRVQFELIGNVLGGGALKLDKIHIRNILTPEGILEQSENLHLLGLKLASTKDPDSILNEINLIVYQLIMLANTNQYFLEEILMRKAQNRFKNVK